MNLNFISSEKWKPKIESSEAASSQPKAHKWFQGQIKCG